MGFVTFAGLTAVAIVCVTYTFGKLTFFWRAGNAVSVDLEGSRTAARYIVGLYATYVVLSVGGYLDGVATYVIQNIP